jgi:hypothetical protein
MSLATVSTLLCRAIKMLSIRRDHRLDSDTLFRKASNQSGKFVRKLGREITIFALVGIVSAASLPRAVAQVPLIAVRFSGQRSPWRQSFHP